MPVSAVVQQATWFGDALLAVATVVVLGLLLHRAGPVLATLGQLVGVLLLLTARFGNGALFGILPGPPVVASFGALLAGAGRQIAVGIVPVVPTPEILFLITGAFGLVTVVVYLAAVPIGAPAAAGVPLLAVFAVPAALSDTLLPWPAMVSACAGFGLLLIARDGGGRQWPGGIAIVAGATAIALAVGALGLVGTAGRFNGTGSGTGNGGAIGLNPFTALRGQLTQNEPTELFQVSDLPQPTYMRALTLRSFVPGSGWEPSRPAPGPTLPGQVAPDPGAAGHVVDVSVTNVGFRDYWLPLFGSPVSIDALPGGQWTFDARSGTAFTAQPRHDGWQQRAALSEPTADQLRSATGTGSPGQDYLDARAVDPRVVALARDITAGRADAFDKAMALQNYFTGPATQFHYNLQTKPGDGDDALVEFLTVGKQGYCEQFASAMAVMLRTVGVPARVAVGFTGGRELNGYRSITTADAHAWVEAWFPGYGWMTFDPTPLTDGRTITPSYVTQAEAQEAAAAGTSTAAAVPTDTPQSRPTADQPTPTSAPTDGAAANSRDRGLPAALVGALTGLLASLVVAATPTALRMRARRQRLAAVAGGGPGAAGAAWAELQAESADRGVPTRESDTVRAAARRLVRGHGLDDPAQDGLRMIVSAVEASWYGGAHPSAGELDDAVRRVGAGMAAGSPLSWRQRLLPRSVTAVLRSRVRGGWRRELGSRSGRADVTTGRGATRR